jgi:hypothetical protein
MEQFSNETDYASAWPSICPEANGPKRVNWDMQLEIIAAIK